MLETDLDQNHQRHDLHGHDTAVAGHARIYYAQVYSQDGTRYGVAGPMGCYWVPLAAGCLLQPGVGDTVLVSIGPQQGYILAVLEQAPDQVSDVCLPANSRLSVAAGSLTIKAAQGVRLHAGSGLQVSAKAASFTFDVMGIQAGHLQLTGDCLQSAWRNRQDVAQQQITVNTHHQQRSGTRVTRIAGHDEHSVGSQRILVERDWRVRANSVDLLAQTRASLDGQQVQLG